MADKQSIVAFTPRNIAGVSVTVLEGEEHGRSAVMTEQVCETGRIISDHIILKPKVVTLRFEQSNTPMTGESAADAVRRVYNYMDSLWAQRNPMTVLTTHASYTDMVLISLSEIHKAPFKWTMKFTATFQQLNTAQNPFTAIPLSEMRNPAQAKEYKQGAIGNPALPAYGYETPFVLWAKANAVPASSSANAVKP